MYGCCKPTSSFNTTNKRLALKLDDQEPLSKLWLIICVGKEHHPKVDFMKKYTEEMLKAKNMMSTKTK